MAIHVTDTVAYWHMPKTGGMYVYKILQQMPGYRRIIGPRRHGPISEIPRGAVQNRTLFGTVRDPWSWYLSVYQMANSGVDGEALWSHYGNGDPSFRAALYGMTHPLDVDGGLPRRFGGVYTVPEAEHEGATHNFLGSGLGLCSWTFRYVYGRPARPSVFIDTAQLTQGMADLLTRPVEEISHIPKENCATHRPHSALEDPASLYDEEMKKWVAEADAPLIEAFGFSEPYGNARNAVMDAEDIIFAPSLR